MSKPQEFFRFLKSKLEAVGFSQASEIDPCLFISEKVICLVYVDDTLLYAQDEKDIDEVLYKLVEEQKMQLEVEDSVAGFLGVLIKKNEQDGSVELAQEGLTDRIIKLSVSMGWNPWILLLQKLWDLMRMASP